MLRFFVLILSVILVCFPALAETASPEAEVKNYTLEKISDEAFVGLFKESYVHSGLVSPDKKVTLEFVSEDPVSDHLFITHKGQKAIEAKDLYSTSYVFWSKDSSKIALVNTDNYAGGGDDYFIVIDVKTLDEVKIDLQDFVKDIEVGNREMFDCSPPGWQDNNKLVFGVRINYLGDSGHPGIDSNRESKLGEKFGVNDPIYLGDYLLTVFEPKSSLEHQ